MDTIMKLTSNTTFHTLRVLIILYCHPLLVFAALLNAKLSQCAKIGYKGMEKGELVIFNEDQLKWMLNWVALFMSRKIVLKISRQFMEK